MSGLGAHGAVLGPLEIAMVRRWLAPVARRGQMEIVLAAVVAAAVAGIVVVAGQRRAPAAPAPAGHAAPLAEPLRETVDTGVVQATAAAPVPAAPGAAVAAP